MASTAQEPADQAATEEARTSEQRIERTVRGELGPTFLPGRVVLAVAVAVALAALVGLASSAAPWQAGSGAIHPHVSSIVGDAMVVVLAAALCVASFLAWALAPQRRRKRNPEDELVYERVPGGIRAVLLTLFVGMLAVAAIVGALYFLLGPAATVQPPPMTGRGQTAHGNQARPLPSPPHGPTVSVHWLMLGLIAGALVLFPVALLLRRRLAVAEVASGITPPVGEVARAVAESIEEIEQEPDPRRAVIRAYARMERALDDAGLPRWRHEAPFEFVGRTLQRLRVSAVSANRLAELFERARFSQHPIAGEAKHDAIVALRDVYRELQAGT